MTNTEPADGWCPSCKGTMYHDGMNWRHTANDRTREFCPQPDPTTDPAMKSRLTIRMEMFEVYERVGDKHRFLFATSDPSEARKQASRDDVIVKRWWTRGEPA